MKRHLLPVFVLAGAVTLGSCANMTETQQRTMSGAAIGTAAGAGVGLITGNWGWAAAGAAVGAGTGYLVDRQARRDQANYERGVQAGKQQAATSPPKPQ